LEGCYGLGMLSDPTQILGYVWSGWIATWPTELFALIWIGWLVSWGAGAFFSGRTEKHVKTWDSRVYRIPIFVGGILLTPWAAEVSHDQPLWHLGNSGTYVLAALTVAGILFTWWSRIHLGELWSNAITRKAGHRIIDSGPYGLVRHPIYTGLIGAILATGIAVATLAALLGSFLIAFGLWQKARMEERFLTIELGEGAYRAYCRRVPMLIPFLPNR
jgi:protein-S-isoprenylcysteine O-methyltransferase Ste14